MICWFKGIEREIRCETVRFGQPHSVYVALCADHRTGRPMSTPTYNLGNFLRRLALLRSVKTWLLTTLREKLIKTGAKVVSHSPYVVFQMAGVAVPKALFTEILERIGRLRADPELAGSA